MDVFAIKKGKVSILKTTGDRGTLLYFLIIN